MEETIMNLKRCENGHFYDADKFAGCPHCSQPVGGGAEVQTTGADSIQGAVPTSPAYNQMVGDSGSEVTLPEESVKKLMKSDGDGSIQSSVQHIMTQPDNLDDEGVTIRFESDQGVEPVVGWLVCIEGKYYGQSFILKTGRNFIGRGHGMDIVLAKDNSVSRDKHAIVLYEPKKREFLAQPGESRSLFYLNDEVVLMTEKLKLGDVLTLGDTKLRFVPCCGVDFGWDDITID